MVTRGNQNLTWDYDNRVTALNITGDGFVNSNYDYAGIRVEKNSNLGTTIFPFEGYRIEPSGVIVKHIRIGIETIAAKKSTGEKLFYHNDHLGGVNVITDINGLVAQLIEYDPWGKISRSEGGGEGIIRFTGQKLDVESGLLYYGGRYYDPELGRFISPDPFVPEMFNPQSLNRYAYVNNNPVNYIDPSGYFHRHKKQSGGFWDSIFGTILRVLFDFVMIWAGLPPGGLLLEGATIGLSAFVGLADLMQQGISALNSGGNDGMSGGDSPGSIIPSLAGAGSGGFFSPALQVAARTGCDVCSDSGWDLLARLIFAAAARQYKIPNAMEGVGHVVRNRVLSKGLGYPKTYRDVIYDTKFGKQFEEVSDDPNSLWQKAANPAELTGANAEAYARALTVAEGVYNGTIPDPTGGAIGFHSLDQYTHPGNPRWEFTRQIGPFRFFKVP